ncbi:ribosomal-protein-alanine N-acetyltransferase [Ruminococcus sp. YE71]|uniref:GNAT family N-acetyltransferase n=1 Tax=unclassified Ruminococcus TaxID=2608920 RepID=UPI00089158DD|nr:MULTISPECIES: GNAT family N-acetyltransferase [unclassified Ruminococcus]SDA20832.1 ribosomal-protein-alanine N-acetyltransferase [Ruminococcus sp. YE78]SFW33541.1 ribosomal-protein-alanine N-acetyltransferase [Ruminococcus sp. YE71]
MKLTLETERLLLRPFETSDAQAVYDNWASDPEVSKYLTWDTHTSVDVSASIVDMWVKEYEKPERLNFAVELKSEHKLIGGIDVVGYLDGEPVIGYALSRAYWGRGIMTEACKKVVGYLFEQGYERIHIDAVRENIGSNRVIEKCGGELVRTDEELFPLKNTTFTVNRYIIRR